MIHFDFNGYAFDVFEDNGGGVHLFVFSDCHRATLLYCHSNYEYLDPGAIVNDIRGLFDVDEDDLLAWDGGMPLSKACDFYQECMLDPISYDLVATERYIDLAGMGSSALRCFGFYGGGK